MMLFPLFINTCMLYCLSDYSFHIMIYDKDSPVENSLRLSQCCDQQKGHLYQRKGSRGVFFIGRNFIIDPWEYIKVCRLTGFRLNDRRE